MSEGEAAGRTEPVAGLLLAAGSGSRLGRPKALVTDASGETWLARAVAALREGGCLEVYVVIGAAAEEVGRRLPAGATAVCSPRWTDGMGASLRAGLGAVAELSPDSSAVIVMLVDTPDVDARVVRRLLASGSGAVALGRSTYNGIPGHPVLIGRDHWAGVVASARGDRGARDYLATHEALLVECGDLATGTDVDTAGELVQWLHGDHAPG